MFTRNKYVLGILASLLAFGAASAADTPATLDDAALASKVKTALIQNNETKAHQINVEVSDGRVQLGGYVDSADQKAAASRVASTVSGVRTVQNNLLVKGLETTADRSTGVAIDDSMVTAKIKSALIADSRTKAYQINVDTREGVVQLGGFVDSAAAKAAATEVAQSISGVKTVQNRLEVKGAK